MSFYNLSFEEVLKELKSDKDKGLSKKEVSSRIEEYGENMLKAKKGINPFVLFINQFKSFIIYILIFAVIISFISGEETEAIIILVILVFNAVFGFIQEYKAEKSIDALSKISAHTTRVVRDSDIEVIEVCGLVPGDIVLLEEGDKVPADCRIISLTLLQTAEAALTGESTSVSKKVEAISGDKTIGEQKNMIFSGTIITSGKARCIVCSTGMQTEIGKIADLISSATKELTPLQKKLESFGKYVASITLVICLLVFVVGVWKDGLFSILFAGDFIGFVFAAKDWFLVAISLAVAAVPEGLPVIVTVALAIGVKKMVKNNSLIRKLPSVETLGGTTVICSDKTGTLTENQMTVKSVWDINCESEITGSGYNPQGKIVNSKINSMLFRAGVLCNDSTYLKKEGMWVITGDPTEGALVVSGKKFGIEFKKIRSENERCDEVPFDSVRKLMSVVCLDKQSKKKTIFTKGAPEAIVSKCSRILDNGKVRKITKADIEKINSQNVTFGSSALRVLGFAYKEFKSTEKGLKMENNLIFIGLQAMLDPPHPEVHGSIVKCHKAGIRVIMITGDNIETAKGIASQIGIVGDSLEGSAFEKLSDLKKLHILKTTNIFARVEPKHKMEIVKILQKSGEVVAMTGDGVNDAPAIKKADIGIAMGINGTDVAKEASDMILLDDKFTSIVKAVEEGRGIYQNIKKFVNYLFSSNLAEVMLIFFAIALSFPLPMTAIMLLWLNLITDGLPAIALSVDPYSKTIMDEKPVRRTERIMDNVMAFKVVYVATLITIAILALIQFGNVNGYSIEKIQTIAFTSMIVMELVRLQTIRSEYGLSMFSNMYLVYAVVFSLALQLLVLYTPLSHFFGTVALVGFDWFMILIATVFVGILNLVGHKLQDKYQWFEE